MPTELHVLTVAVTGPDRDLRIPDDARLQVEERDARVIGMARRPFEPAEHGWMKINTCGDVRSPRR